MDMNSYRYFVALEKYKTISATARKLYLTQPALTNYIKRIEQELGVPLIERSVSPIRFTAYGKIFLKFSQEIASLDQRLHETLESAMQSAPNTVRIALSAAGMTALCNFLEPFKETIPDLDMNLIEGSAADCEERLEDGSADIGFMTSPMLSPMLEAVELWKIPMAFILAESHFLMRGRDLRGNCIECPQSIELKDLQGQIFVLGNPRSGLGRYARWFLKENKVIPGQTIQLDSITAGYHMVSNGNSIMFFPTSSHRESNQRVIFCTLADIKMTRSVILVRNPNIPLSQPAQQMWDAILNIMEKTTTV